MPNKKITLTLIYFCFYLYSCVYFNTFYNAKNSFEEANEIISNDYSTKYSNNQDISTTAKKLLKESIASSNIVLTKYSDSEYVDDATYYIGRSYFSLGEFYKSKKYFNQLIQDYPNSKYQIESRLWVEYCQLKLDLLDLVLSNISVIEKTMEYNQEKDENLFFLLHSIKGDFFVKIGDLDRAFIEFERALTFTNSKSKKTNMYSKLVYISEAEHKFSKAAEYLEKIIISSNNSNTRVESFRKWIIVKKFDKKYDDVIFEIKDKLNSSDFQSDKLQDELSIELAIVYMDNQNYSQAKNLLNKITDRNSSDMGGRQGTVVSTAYYWLGYISLVKEFDLDLSQEYFQLVFGKDEEEQEQGRRRNIGGRQSSRIFKESEKYLDEIKLYKQLLDPDTSDSQLEDEIKKGFIEQESIKDIPVGNSIVLGNPKAPIVIIKWIDFQCPYCAKSVSLIDDVLKKYPNDVKVVVKNFPLSFHKQARKAAKYALAASRQDKYKEMYHMIMENFRELKTNEDLPLEYAQELGLDMDKFKRDAEDPYFEDLIKKESLELAQNFDRKSVPKFLVAGKEPSSRSLAAWSRMIDKKRLKIHTSECQVCEDSLDSLNRIMQLAEKLYFDFNQTELAIKKYKEVINLDPESDYAIRSQKIIDNLNGIIDTSNNLQQLDSLQILIDAAWNQLDYNQNKSIKMFKDIASKFDDFQSYYSLAIIYEDYAYKPDLSIYYYLESFYRAEDESFRKTIKNKLLLLEEMIKSKIDTINQKLDYVNGMDFLLNEFDLDSANKYFIKSSLLNESVELSRAIDNYLKSLDDIQFESLKDSILKPNWKHQKYKNEEIDSIIYDLANTSYWLFRNDSLAKQYNDLIEIKDSSNYYNSSIKLTDKIKNKDFNVDSTNFEFYSLSSKKYIDYYNTIVISMNDYKEPLSEYNNLLNYLSESIHIDQLESVEIETINIQDTTKVEGLDRMQVPNMKNNMLPNINIDINLKNEKNKTTD